MPYEGSALAALFMTARLRPRAHRRAVNGMDNGKEMSVLFCGLEFARGGCIRSRSTAPAWANRAPARSAHPLRLRSRRLRAAYDYVTSRPDVDPKRVTVMGYSFGGYYASRIVAFDKRYAACVAFGAARDLDEWELKIKTVTTSAPKSVRSRTSSGVGGRRHRRGRGLEIAETLAERRRPAHRLPVARRAAATTASFHSTPRRSSTIWSARSKTIKIFTAEDGGAEHGHVDNRQVGVDFAADWLAENMK